MNTIKRLWYHPWTVAASNWLLMMVVFMLMRLFFYRVNIDLYPDVSSKHLLEMCLGGIRFDMTALLYLNSVYLLLMLLPLPWRWRTNIRYQQVASLFYFIPNFLGIFANAVDTVYVRFTDRRTTMAFFTEFENDGNLFSILSVSSAQYWYVSLFALAMFVIASSFRRTPYTDLRVIDKQSGLRRIDQMKVLLIDRDAPWEQSRYYLREIFILCVSVYFIVIGIRGGFGMTTRPITMSNALQYTNRPAETNIILNTPFCIMRSLEGTVYSNPGYFAETELEEIYTPVHNAATKMVAYPVGKDMNVVVLILESFAKEHIGFYNRDLDGGTYTGYTPFLDSLLTHSTTFVHSYATGRKSIDAMPSVLASIPRFGSSYILTPYYTNSVNSLASLLGKKGYQTGFFHGAPNGSMGFLAFARSCGFEAYYGKDEYGNDADYDGYWAIWDEEFLQFYGRTMSGMREPFMTAVFTASSHHPFQVPKRYEGVFPEGSSPLHRCIGYTDNALRKFFDCAKRQSWYKNTLFVLTADHTNELVHAEYQNDKGVYEVPIIFFSPMWNEGRVDSTTAVSQADIMPTVLGVLGYDEPFVAFGEDVLTEKYEHKYVVNYNEPVYQCFSDSLLLQFDGQKPIRLYDYTRDRLLQNNLLNDHSDDEEVQRMLRYMKAYIQQYYMRMITNQLVINNEQ